VRNWARETNLVFGGQSCLASPMWQVIDRHHAALRAQLHYAGTNTRATDAVEYALGASSAALLQVPTQVEETKLPCRFEARSLNIQDGHRARRRAGQGVQANT